jgi:hypothetical protein
MEQFPWMPHLAQMMWTLMGFDVHHIGLPLTWIITSQQIVNDFDWMAPTFENENVVNHA